jgi:hypothetical protein
VNGFGLFPPSSSKEPKPKYGKGWGKYIYPASRTENPIGVPSQGICRIEIKVTRKERKKGGG